MPLILTKAYRLGPLSLFFLACLVVTVVLIVTFIIFAIISKKYFILSFTFMTLFGSITFNFMYININN